MHEETVGKPEDDIQLTAIEKEVMDRMNKGWVMFLLRGKEWLSLNLNSLSNPLKKGTIAGLVDKGLIYKSHVWKTVYYLTDLGRKYKN